MTEYPETLAHGTLHSGLAANGSLRWVLADLTDIVETLRQRRDLSPSAAVALGQLMTGTSLVLRLMTKTPQRLIVEARGDGPLQRLMAEAHEDGTVRSMISDPRLSEPTLEEGAVGSSGLPATDIAVRPLLGNGTLEVIRQLPGGQRYTSKVELVDGGLSQNLAHYLAQSEQIHSAVLLGVLNRPEGVVAAGGLVIEALPGTDDDVLSALEENLASMKSVSRCLEQGVSALLDAVLGDIDRERLELRTLGYRCGCDRERLLTQLQGLPSEDRDYLRQNPVTEAECAYCGTQYTFRAEELAEPS